jgi:phospholipase/lecithinase/hemolysin
MFNTYLAADLASLESANPTLKLTELDTYPQFEAIKANPAAYGLTNVSGAASTTSGADASTYLFWDSIHPTTVEHNLIATAAYNAMAVPEPASITTAILAIIPIWLFGMGRRSLAALHHRGGCP